MRPLPATRYELGPGRPRRSTSTTTSTWTATTTASRISWSGTGSRRAQRAHGRDLYRGRRVAGHRRSRVRGGHTTCGARTCPNATARTWPGTRTDHRLWRAPARPPPSSSPRSWPAARTRSWATARLGILRLAQRYLTGRVEAACRRALLIGARSYRSVDSILAHGLDAQPRPPATAPSTTDPPRRHEQLRGPGYYQ